MPIKYSLENLREIANKRGIDSSNLDKKQLCHFLGIDCLLDDKEILHSSDNVKKNHLENIQKIHSLRKRINIVDHSQDSPDSTFHNVVMR